MIKLLEQPAEPIKSALGARVASFMYAYGFDFGFARFWEQRSSSGERALIASVDGNVTVAGEVCDADELARFLYAIGYANVMSDVPLGLENGRKFDVYLLVCDGAGKAPEPPEPHEPHGPPELPDYRVAYAALASEFDMPPFDVWYVDICHRVRHSTAVIEQLSGGVAVAAGFEGEWLITGIAVPEADRRSGIGRELIHLLAESNGCRRLYAAVKTEAAAEFYCSCGFEKTAEIFEYGEVK